MKIEFVEGLMITVFILASICLIIACISKDFWLGLNSLFGIFFSMIYFINKYRRIKR